jgi:hypothetical protein
VLEWLALLAHYRARWIVITAGLLSGENDYVSVVPLTAGYGGALFPVAYVTQAGAP